MDRPLPFEDSFSTADGRLSITVGSPGGNREEAVILEIDGDTDALVLDEGATDLVIEMLEAARVNLGLRRQHGQRG